MKKTYTLLLLLLIPTVQGVNIHEVYYDPINTEAGGEAIVFYNPSDAEVDMSGWYITTESSDEDAIFPQGTIIHSKGYFLLADNSWSEQRDNSYWPNADYEEPITLSNTDGGVALLDEDGTVIDVVGWGDVEGIEKNLFTGTPAVDVTAGKSLLRVDDTNNNGIDFIEHEPVILSKQVPFVTNSTQSAITLSITVTSLDANIKSFILQGEHIIEGNKVLLTPGKTTNATIELTLHESQGEVIFNGEQMNEEEGTYYAPVSFEHTTSPGPYSFDIEVGDEKIDLDYEILPMIALDIKDPRITLEGRNGEKVSSQQPKIRNIGNVPFEIGIKGTDLSSSDNRIDVKDVFFSLGNKTPTYLTKELAYTSHILYVNQEIPFNINTNLNGIDDGKYEGSILVVAREVK